MSTIEYKGHFLKSQKPWAILNIFGGVLGPSQEEEQRKTSLNGPDEESASWDSPCSLVHSFASFTSVYVLFSDSIITLSGLLSFLLRGRESILLN